MHGPSNDVLRDKDGRSEIQKLSPCGHRYKSSLDDTTTAKRTGLEHWISKMEGREHRPRGMRGGWLHDPRDPDQLAVGNWLGVLGRGLVAPDANGGLTDARAGKAVEFSITPGGPDFLHIPQTLHLTNTYSRTHHHPRPSDARPTP